MNPEEWERVVDAFQGALEIAPERREPFLEGELGDCSHLLAEVHSLLANHEEEPGFLENPAVRVTAPGDEPPEPERIGPYRVVEKLGSGGMGVVYLAERGEPYRQRVAVKLLKRGMDSEQILARFRAERQILASLEHPGIARLIDGGVAEDGRPYLVLGYIEEAAPIDRYCLEHELGVQDRLELFLEACEAVQYAHRKLVIHRDLKPSNLLVSKDGRVRLLDFGIAKLLDPATVDVTRQAPTVADVRPMTPAYASPEQIRGEPLSTTSDVYSLGVILYELLTGEKPYRVEHSTPAAVAEALREREREREPERPSTAALRSAEGDAATAGGRLEGDLDNIVLKTLRTEPEERYRSVEALAEDILRFLNHRPVLARPHTVRYRLRRFVERHTVAVVLAGLALLSLVGGLAGTLWQAGVARLERDRARAEAHKAERVADVLVDLFNLSDPGRERDAPSMTVREFADLAQDELGNELGSEPEVLARLETVMGRLNMSLARYDSARQLLESALATQRELYPRGHLDLAETLYYESIYLRYLRDPEGAKAAATEALAMRRSLLPEDDLGVADLLELLGSLANAAGDRERATSLMGESLEIRRRLLPASHPLIGEGLSGLATVAYGAGDYARAVELGRRALEAQRAAHGTVHQAVAHELNNLGAYLFSLGEYASARETLEEAVRVRTAVYGPEHPFVAFSLVHLGRLAAALGDPETAVEHLERALDLRVRAYGHGHPLVATSLSALGAVWTAAGQPERGATLLEEAAEIEQRHPEESSRKASVLVALGRNQLARGLLEEATTTLREAVEMRYRISGATHPRTAEAETALARALLEVGDAKGAAPLLGHALETFQVRLPEGHLDAAPAYLAEGDLERLRGRPGEAADAYEGALAIFEGKLPAGDPRIAAARGRLLEL